MRLYELVLVLRPTVSEADRKKLLTSVKDSLKEVAKVVKEEDWGQKPLAYKIKKEAAGVYHMLQLESEKGIKPDFEKSLFANDSVLRHLMIRKK